MLVPVFDMGHPFSFFGWSPVPGAKIFRGSLQFFSLLCALRSEGGCRSAFPQGETTMRTLTMLKVPAGFIAAVIAVASLAPAAQALDQDPGFAVKMNVPFAFQTATGQHFNPGIYTIRMNSQQTLLIRGTAAAGLVMTQVAADGLPAANGKAVFTHYGGRYFLRAVWVAGNDSHLLCATSKAERQLQVAAGKTPAAVELALLKTGR
jgi:hypothetical protein